MSAPDPAVAQPTASGQKLPAEDRILGLVRQLNDRTLPRLSPVLNSLPPSRIAHLLESSPPRPRQLLWSLIDDRHEAEVLSSLATDVRVGLMEKMDPNELANLSARMDLDELVEALDILPKRVTSEVLMSMDRRDRDRLESQMLWPGGTVGALMSRGVMSMRGRDTAYVATQYLSERLRGQEPADLGADIVCVVDEEDRYLGAVPLWRLVAADRQDAVRTLIDPDVIAVRATDSPTDLMSDFESNDWGATPVVDAERRLVGVLRPGQIVDLVAESRDATLRAGVGVEEDTFAPLVRASPRRLLWLLVNLGTALAATFVISLFGEVLAAMVALAFLMPIVASMGGIAATQTLTIVVRARALGQLNTANLRWLLGRELAVAAICGSLLGLGIGAGCWLWLRDPLVALTIGGATSLNILIASVSGVLVPSLLTRLGMDAAVSGAVIVTTITDVAGFAIFLGGATLLLLG